jgi:hypothetical protein
MGSSRSKPLPKPPKIEEPPRPSMEADMIGQEQYFDKAADNRMSVQNTLMRNFKKKKKNIFSRGLLGKIF